MDVSRNCEKEKEKAIKKDGIRVMVKRLKCEVCGCLMEDHIIRIPPYSPKNWSGKTRNLLIYMCPRCDYTIDVDQLKYRRKSK